MLATTRAEKGIELAGSMLRQRVEQLNPDNPEKEAYECEAVKTLAVIEPLCKSLKMNRSETAALGQFLTSDVVVLEDQSDFRANLNNALDMLRPVADDYLSRAVAKEDNGQLTLQQAVLYARLGLGEAANQPKSLREIAASLSNCGEEQVNLSGVLRIQRQSLQDLRDSGLINDLPDEHEAEKPEELPEWYQKISPDLASDYQETEENQTKKPEIIIIGDKQIQVGDHIIELDGHVLYLFNAFLTYKGQRLASGDIMAEDFHPNSSQTARYDRFRVHVNRLIKGLNQYFDEEVFTVEKVQNNMFLYRVRKDLAVKDMRGNPEYHNPEREATTTIKLATTNEVYRQKRFEQTKQIDLTAFGVDELDPQIAAAVRFIVRGGELDFGSIPKSALRKAQQLTAGTDELASSYEGNARFGQINNFLTGTDSPENSAGELRNPAGKLNLPDAACKGEDPEMFFPTSIAAIADAKAICKDCPDDTRNACLEFALDTEENYGVWGGLTDGERKKLLRKRSVRTNTRL